MIASAHDVTYITSRQVAVGSSKRIVIDLDDVQLKRQLYSALAQEGVSLKGWFVAAANAFLRRREDGSQLELPVLHTAETASPYGKTPPKGKP